MIDDIAFAVSTLLMLFGLGCLAWWAYRWAKGKPA